MTGPQPSEAEPPAGSAPETTTDSEHFAGEHNRRVPRSAWWVLAVAVVILLVILAARPGWFDRDTANQRLKVPADRYLSTTIADLGSSDGFWLNDEAPSSTFRIKVPVDTDLSRIRWRLRATTQVPADSTVFLSVAFNGVQADRRQLESGEHKINELIDVPASAVRDGVVRIQVRLSGFLNETVCVADRDTGANVHIRPESMLEAAMGRRPSTVRDVASLWHEKVTVVVATDDPSWWTAAAQLGVALSRDGHQVDFRSDLPDSTDGALLLMGETDAVNALGWKSEAGEPVAVGTLSNAPTLAVRSTDVTAAAQQLTGPALVLADSPGSDPLRIGSSTPTGGEVGVANLGTDLTPATIIESHSWRMRYSLADMPGGKLPREARLAMELPASPADLTWVVNTQLNGHLIDSRPLVKGRAATIPLPAQFQRVSNTVTFTVQRDRNLGGCDVRQTPYSMAVSPSSALVLGEPAPNGFVAVPAALQQNVQVVAPSGSAEDTAALLTATMGTVAEFVPTGALPEFRWDGTPPAAPRPFIALGSIAGLATPLSVQGDRVVSASGRGLDTGPIDSGLVLSVVYAGNDVRGLALTPIGQPGVMQPYDLGFQSAEVLTAHGSVAVDREGRLFGPDTTATDEPG